MKRLLDRPAESRIVILLTDGASNTGELPPDRAAQLAAQSDIRIHTIGFAGSGTAFSGNDLDEQSLREVAETTGGSYFRAGDGDELEAVYRLIDALEPTEQNPDTVRPVISFAFVPIATAWLLGCLLLVARRRTPRVA